MNSKSSLRHFLALTGSSILALSSASALTYYWDNNGTGTTGFGTAGGTWTDTGSTLWSGSATGDADATLGTSVTTTTTDSLNFGTAGNGLAAGTINVSNTVNAGTITFGSLSGSILFSGGTINLAAAATINTLNSVTTEISSLITGAGTSFTKSGNGTLRLSNAANTYTGATIIGSSTSGTLEVTFLTNGGLASSIGASSSAASNLVICHSNAAGNLSYVGATNATTDRLFTIGAQAGQSAGILSNGIGTVNFTNTGAVGHVGTNAARTLILGGTNTGQNILSVQLANNGSGALTVNKSGAGTWVLANNSNSYTGTTTVSGGALVITSINDAGLASAIGMGALVLGNANSTGALVYTGAAAESNRTIQINSSTNTNTGGAAILNYGTGALTFDATTFNNVYTNASASTRVLTLGGTNGGTITGAIVNNSATSLVGISKAGSGTWTLQGNNLNTGASSATGGGNLVLDYTSNTLSKLSDSAALTLGGGTLGGSTITLKGGTGLTEIVLNTVVSAGASFITRDGGDTVLQMNAITRQNGGSISFLNGTVAKTTTANNAFGMFGAWATIGDNFAANDGSGNIVAFSGTTTALPSTGTGAGLNYTLTGDQNQTGTSELAAATLKLTGTGGTDNTLALGGTNLKIQNNADTLAGGILYIGGGTGVFNITADATKGIYLTNGSRDLIINTVRDTLHISAKLNSTFATDNVLKAGAGTLVLSSTENVYTGAVYVNEGVLRLASAAAAGTTAGGIRVQHGAALELSNGITIGAEALDLDGNGITNGGALRNQAGTNTYGGAIAIGASGARINADATTSLELTGGIATKIFQNVTIGGAGNTTVSTTAISGSGSVIKDGAGNLTLSATNTYTGATNISNGTLIVNGSISNSSLTTVASGATIAGSGTIGALTVSSGGFINPGNSPGTLDAGNYSQAGLYTAEITGLTPETQHDQINVTGTVNIAGGSLTALFSGLATYSANDLIFILLNDGTDAITGTYTGLAQGATLTSYGGFDWQISYTANNTGIGTGTFTGGNDIALIAVIPEPSTLMLGSLGLLVLFRRRR